MNLVCFWTRKVAAITITVMLYCRISSSLLIVNPFDELLMLKDLNTVAGLNEARDHDGIAPARTTIKKILILMVVIL